MARRSLKASESGIIKAKQAFRRTGWTQEYLASEVGLETRQSIWKFFSGRPIERHLFIDVCFRLDLDWEEIACRPEELDIGLEPVLTPSAHQGWIQQARQQLLCTIEATCGTLQTALDTSHPLAIDAVYTEAHVLRQLNHRRWMEISELQIGGTARREWLSPDRQQTQGVESAVEVAAACSKLVILGKPGIGKTTFLQHLAMQCIQEVFDGERLPVLISLHSLAIDLKTNPSLDLFERIYQQLQPAGLSQEQVKSLLQEGKVLLLLDGLDEVIESERNVICYQIQQFAELYHHNRMIVTSRLAGLDYQFRGFTYVEMADFDQNQIETFIRKWFAAMNEEIPTTGAAKAEEFINQLQHPDHRSIRELASTPLLLHLTCLVFQEQNTLPIRPEKLYQAGLAALLTRWDSARGIQRDQNFPLPLKRNVLAHLAMRLLEQGRYVFEKSEGIQMIANHLMTLPYAYDTPEMLWAESEDLLRSIALQHGLIVERAHEIYAFSHTVFQEYLAAQAIVSRHLLGNPTVLQNLANQAIEEALHPVVLLTINLLPNPIELLMALRQTMHELIEETPQLGTTDFRLDLAIAQILQLLEAIEPSPTPIQIGTLWSLLDLEQRFEIEPEFAKMLEWLKALLPDPDSSAQEWHSWWQTNGNLWKEQFCSLLMDWRDMEHVWKFNPQQQQQLQQYFGMTHLLTECLNRATTVNSLLRRELEQGLLLEQEQFPGRNGKAVKLLVCCQN